MNETNRSLIYSVLFATLRPVASMLLRFGVSWQDFSELAKNAYVDAAADESDLRGQPANISRIAILTGLSRKEVRRIRGSALVTGLPDPAPRNPLAELLHLWHTDVRFCSPRGVPRSLAWAGRPASFEALVEATATGVPAGSLRAELIRMGAVVAGNDGRLTAVHRYVVPVDAGDRLLQGLQFGMRPLALTVARNVQASDTGGLRFQRVVRNHFIAPHQRAELEAQLSRRLGEFSEEIDDALAEAEDLADRQPSGAVGIGLFYFEDQSGSELR